MPAAPTPRVLLTVATFRRPADLAALLPLLERAAAEISPAAAIVVVDNDPDACARDQIALHPGVTYRHEPRPGIAAARNASLAAARERGIAWVAFLDDDERPDPGWLAALVRAMQEWRPAAVSGPVISVFEQEPDAWVRGSGTFESRPHAHGARIRGAATNNLLIDREVLDDRGLAFDDAFGLTGGSDSMLTRAMTHQGLEIRWTSEAVVREVVPVARTRRSWIVSRHRRTGNDWSRVTLALADGRREQLPARLRLVVTGVRRAVRGVIGSAMGAARRDAGRRGAARCDLATARGVLEGVFGRTRTEYARPGAS
ncbi:glycosyltransferase family 2 protein [Nakamurella sp. A5-74]|uniref:Glycosyltransferase family 2 protein n=1 Tax=Nakamurella sp. A5-74 TaxID=3158264 RepID=A0AAU8DN43_9ACTN